MKRITNKGKNKIVIYTFREHGKYISYVTSHGCLPSCMLHYCLHRAAYCFLTIFKERRARSSKNIKHIYEWEGMKIYILVQINSLYCVWAKNNCNKLSFVDLGLKLVCWILSSTAFLIVSLCYLHINFCRNSNPYLYYYRQGHYSLNHGVHKSFAWNLSACFNALYVALVKDFFVEWSVYQPLVYEARVRINNKQWTNST